LISKLRDLGHTPFWPNFIYFFWFSIPYLQSACKIWGLYL